MSYNKSRLLAVLREHEVQAVIASTKENIRYFLGIEPAIKVLNPHRGACFAVFSALDPERIHFVTFLGEVDQVLDATVPVGKIHCFGTFYREVAAEVALTADEERLRLLSDVRNSFSDPAEALSSLLEDLGLSSARIGLDEDGQTGGVKGKLEARFPSLSIIPASDLIRHVRAEKTEREVDFLRTAARVNEAAIQETTSSIYDGINEQEIARIYEGAVVARGGRPALTLIKIGRQAVAGQTRQNQSRLKSGDVIWFDCDIAVDGYWSDIARVYCYKEAKPATKRYEALLAGQNAAIDNIRPGMTGEEVFQLTMQAVHRAGFPDYRRNHVGHGIGVEPYERPILMPGEETRVETGMVLSLETPFYEFGFGALHVEDPILVGEKHNQILTQSGRELRVIGI